MNKNDITTLIRFNFWANDRLLAACQQLSTDEFTRLISPDPGWGSLRGVLVHILDTEFGWRAILEALETDKILEGSDFQDLSALKARWEEEQTAWLNFVNRVSDAKLEKTTNEHAPNAPTVWQTILHVVTHGIQHRGEAALILTGYGSSPGELDFDVFLRESPDSPS